MGEGNFGLRVGLRYPKPQFVTIAVDVFNDKRLTPSLFAVLAALKSFADYSTMECWPSLKSVAERSWQSERNVRRSLRELELLGYIKTSHRKSESGDYTSNVYTIVQDINSVPISPQGQSDTGWGQNSTKKDENLSGGTDKLSVGGDELSVQVRTNCPQNYNHIERDPKNTSNIVFCSSEKNNLENIEYYCPTEREKQKRARLDEFSGEFEKIWALYPRHEGKKVACNSYCKQRSEGAATFEDVKKAVENYARRCREEGTQHKYIKMGSTFFGPNMYWQDFVNPDSSVSGGMMEPTPASEFAEQRRCVREDFGGDFTAYQRWIIDGKPYSISPKQWLEQRAERERAGDDQERWDTPDGSLDSLGDKAF